MTVLLGGGSFSAGYGSRLIGKLAQAASGELAIISQILPAGKSLINDSISDNSVILILSGWCVSSKFQSNGNRSITDVLLPQDLLCENSLIASGETIVAVDEVVCARLKIKCAPSHPVSVMLREMTLFAFKKRYSRMAEHLVSMGRRGAIDRIGHLLLEFGIRSEMKISNNCANYTCPLTQTDIADATGLSSVHVNRVLKNLRQRNLVSIKNGSVNIMDYERLAEMAEFDLCFLAS